MLVTGQSNIDPLNPGHRSHMLQVSSWGNTPDKKGRMMLYPPFGISRILPKEVTIANQGTVAESPQGGQEEGILG